MVWVVAVGGWGLVVGVGVREGGGTVVGDGTGVAVTVVGGVAGLGVVRVIPGKQEQALFKDLRR